VSDRVVVRAAGGIVARGEGAERRYGLVHRPRYDDWSFPKGKLFDGESDETAALREVLEETGLSCRLDERVGAVTYADRNGRPKIVSYWRMTPEGGDFVPTEEVDSLRWATADEALAVLTYPHDRELFRTVLSPGASSPIYVIRHAKAGERERWQRPDAERPITRRGRRQAERLVERFEGLALERIISSPFVRCIQTVAPLAKARGLDVELSHHLAEGADLDHVTDLVRSLDARPTAICGHGREIDAIVEVCEREGASLEGVRGLAKGSVWVLERRDGLVVSARYLPPPGP